MTSRTNSEYLARPLASDVQPVDQNSANKKQHSNCFCRLPPSSASASCGPGMAAVNKHLNKPSKEVNKFASPVGDISLQFLRKQAMLGSTSQS